MKTFKYFLIWLIGTVLLINQPLFSYYKPFEKDSLIHSENPVLYEVKLDRKKVELPPMKPLKMKKSEIIALGIVISSAWGAYFAKKEADNYYKKYMQTGDQSKIKTYWDESRKYDRISEVMLTISYISTGYIMKRLLFD